MLSLGFAAVVLHALSGSTVQGTVRASDSGEPIPGVMVEAVDRVAVTWTDATGHYALNDLPSGAHLLRASRLGYVLRTAEVFLRPDSPLRVDIVLTPRPITLGQVRVEAPRKSSTSSAAADKSAMDDAERAGRRFADSRLQANPAFGEPDVLQTLSILPEVAVRPEFPTALHVQGGSGDENLILLDGVPLYNAFHAAGALTALNPDVVRAVSISPGAPSARHGGALSGVVWIETIDPAAVHLQTSGSLGARMVGQTVSHALPRGVGTIVVSGRRSTEQLFPFLTNQGNGGVRFGELFAKGTLRSRHGHLEIFALTSADRVAFDARVDGTPIDGAATVGDELTSATNSATSSLQNGFAWRTGTQAIIWRGRDDASVKFNARAWHTRFAGDIDWSASTGPVRLMSGLSHSGVAADASRHFSSHLLSGGVNEERLQTEYTLRSSNAHGSAIPTFLARASRDMLSAFLEDEWRMAPSWTLRLGARALIGSGLARDVDPRLSVSFTPNSRLTLSAGYARTHQYVQSLRNEESILDAVVGIALPVVAAAGGAPVARSDALTLSMDSYLGSGATLRLGGYSRRLGGLLLIAPTTAQPFALTGGSRGRGRASGLTALLDWRGARLSGHAGYGFATSHREAGATFYRPSFVGSHAFNMAVGYRPTTGTVLRAALWSGTGRPTSIVDGDLQWAPHRLLSGADEMAGTPEGIVGPLNGERLPAYARVDLGARHEWRIGWNGHSADVTAILNLTNVLNRANALGRTLSSDGHTRGEILMARRAVTLGLAWRL